MINQDYSKLIEVEAFSLKKLLNRSVIDLLSIKSSSTIIEFGCGLGLDADFIIEKTGASVIGLDNNIQLLNNPTRFVKKIYTDLENPPYNFKTSTIDGIYFYNLLHLIQDKRGLLNETFRVLKNEGKLFFLFTTEEQIRNRYINKYFPSLEQIEYDRHHSKNQLIKLLEDIGYNKIKIVSVEYNQCVVNESYFAKIKAGAISSILHIDKKERIKGFEEFKKDLSRFKIDGNYPNYRRYRKAILAQKT